MARHRRQFHQSGHHESHSRSTDPEVREPSAPPGSALHGLSSRGANQAQPPLLSGVSVVFISAVGSGSLRPRLLPGLTAWTSRICAQKSTTGGPHHRRRIPGGHPRYRSQPRRLARQPRPQPGPIRRLNGFLANPKRHNHATAVGPSFAFESCRLLRARRPPDLLSRCRHPQTWRTRSEPNLGMSISLAAIRTAQRCEGLGPNTSCEPRNTTARQASEPGGPPRALSPSARPSA